MPPSLSGTDDDRGLPEALPVMNGWVRGTLAGVALGLAAVFALAFWLDPYDGGGAPRRMETHRQLGLPPCTFYRMTGLPCPSCGMTTSFALLVRGDVGNSLRANAAGTALAAFCLLLVPWCVAAVATGRTPFVRSLDRALTGVVLTFLTLMLVRWAAVVGLGWWRGS